MAERVGKVLALMLVFLIGFKTMLGLMRSVDTRDHINTKRGDWMLIILMLGALVYLVWRFGGVLGP